MNDTINENSNVYFSDFESPIRCAEKIEEQVLKMIGYLQDLESVTERMSWSGGRASEFKNKVASLRNDLNDVYKRYIKNIPVEITNSIEKYKNEEE